MVWTVRGVVVADENGWTAAAANLVHRVPRGSATAHQEHQGPSGYKTTPARIRARATADMAAGYRARRRMT